MLEGYVKDNYYTNFTLPAIICAEKTTLRHKKLQCQLSMKCWSRALGVCLKDMSRTTSMQGFTLTGAEKTKVQHEVLTIGQKFVLLYHNLLYV